MVRVPLEELEEKKGRKSVGKKRKVAEAGIEEVPLEDFLRLEEEAEEEGRKKRRTTRTTKGPSLLDLSDAVSWENYSISIMLTT